LNCVTYRALNDAKSIVSHEKLKKRQWMTKAAICIPIAARRYACHPGCTTPYQNPSPSLLLLRRVIAALYRSEPRTVFGALNRRCPKPILEDGCDINRQGRKIPRGWTDKAYRDEAGRKHDDPSWSGSPRTQMKFHIVDSFIILIKQFFFRI